MQYPAIVKHRHDNIQPTASHFINGQYIEDERGEKLEVIYPATGEVIATLHASTPAIVEQALSHAKQAQQDWAALGGTARGRILRRAADIIRERNQVLSVLETYDTGKPIQETLVADATLRCGCNGVLRWTGGQSDR